MRRKKRNCVVFAALLTVFLFSTTVSVFAESDIVGSTVEIDKSGAAGEQMLTANEAKTQGSISVRLEDTVGNRSKKGVSMAVVKVADVVGGKFEIKEVYASCGVNLNNIRNANELEIAAANLLKNTVAQDADQRITTDAEGTAKTEALSAGVYLIYAADRAEYENIAPSLVSIPSFDEKKGEMVYDVEVLPKHTAPKQEGGRSVPQTGVDDKTLEYGMASLGLFVAAVLAGAVALGTKRKTNNVKGSRPL